MSHRIPQKRSGFTLIELLVVIAIMGVLAGMLMQGVQKAREAAKRIECVNNLRNMGFAMHNQESAAGIFPSEVQNAQQPGTKVSFYTLILGELEQNQAAAALQKNPNQTTGLGNIKTFLCPSRRAPQQAPGKRDYGYVSFGNGGSGARSQAVLDFPGGSTITVISNNNGTSQTAVMSHLWMSPQNYTTGQDPTDGPGWAGTPPQNSRTSPLPFQDLNSQGNTSSMGSPHPTVMPVLFADNHTSNLGYSTFSQGWPLIWNCFNQTPINFPN